MTRHLSFDKYRFLLFVSFCIKSVRFTLRDTEANNDLHTLLFASLAITAPIIVVYSTLSV